MRLYLSGPMTGKKDFNYPAFREAASHLRSKGYDVFDPSELFDGDSSLPKYVYMKEDIRGLLDSDVLVLLDGWENSLGVRVEMDVAVACDIPIKEFKDYL
jgi:hypothetical protein